MPIAAESSKYMAWLPITATTMRISWLGCSYSQRYIR